MLKGLLKHKFLLIVIVLLIIGAAGMAGGDDEEPTKNQTNEDVVETSQTKKKTPKAEEKVYKIGDKLTVGDVRYKVTNVSTSKKVGSRYLNAKAQGRFLIISIQITNKGDEALTVSDSFFKLINGKKTYEVSNDTIYADDSIILKEINPDITLKGKIIFDVPEKIAKAKDNYLQVQTGFWGTEKGSIALTK